MDNVELQMDVYYPMPSDGPSPVLLYVHGGGWWRGDKGAIFPDHIALVEAGFLVASVNYRLILQYQFPAMIEDVKCAVRYLRAHADQYNIDPERIGAWGASAGGHLVSLLGLADETAGWDVGQYLEYSSEVKAVVDLFGPTDLRNLRNFDYKDLYVDDAHLDDASPVQYVTADAPSFLIMHGEDDTVVPLEQSLELYSRLVENGVDAKIVIVKNSGHGFKQTGDVAMRPTSEEIMNMIVDFFTTVLE